MNRLNRNDIFELFCQEFVTVSFEKNPQRIFVSKATNAVHTEVSLFNLVQKTSQENDCGYISTIDFQNYIVNRLPHTNIPISMISGE